MRPFIVRYPDPVCKPLGMRHGGLPPRGARSFSRCPHVSPHGALPLCTRGGLHGLSASAILTPARDAVSQTLPLWQCRIEPSQPSPPRSPRNAHTRARSPDAPGDPRVLAFFQRARHSHRHAKDGLDDVTTSRDPTQARKHWAAPTSGPRARSTPSGIKTRGYGSATPYPPRHGSRHEDGRRAHLVATDTPACALGLERWTNRWRGCPGAAVHGSCTAYRRGLRASEVLRIKERESVPTCCIRCSHTVCSLPWIIEEETRDAKM